MGMNKVERLDEGPFDFIRGAAGEVGRGVATAAKTVQRGVGNVVQAGRAASMEAEFEKGAAQLVQLLQQRGAARKPTAQAQPQQAAQAQAKPQQAAPQAAAKPQAQRTATADKPRMRPGKYGNEYVFSSFLQDISGDQINEGLWDFMGGVKNAAMTKVRDKIEKYGNQDSVIKDLYHAGRDASAAGDAAKAAKQSEQVAGQIKALGMKLSSMLQQMGPNGPAVLSKVLKQTPAIHRDTLRAILTKQA